MLENNEKSQYVSGNRGSTDTMPDDEADIYLEVTRFLQERILYG
jgi:hypothetical protein